MAIEGWFRIGTTAADEPYRVRIAELMHAMDPRYSALHTDQLTDWLQSSTIGYRGKPASAFMWFASGQKTQPADAELCLLYRYDDALVRADWLMSGWVPPSLDVGGPTAAELAHTLDRIAAQLISWMEGLAPSDPTKGLIFAVRPQSFATDYMNRLYDLGYQDAKTGVPRGDCLVSIAEETVFQRWAALGLQISRL